MQYVELHNHTYYSPLDGLSSPEEYCKRAKEIGIDAIAMTDHGTVAGHRHFQRATTAAGITPILGVEAYISETDRFDKRSKAKREDGTNTYNHIILLAKNDQGVRELNELSGIGWTEGFYNKPRIDFDALSTVGHNLIVLSGCMSGLISKALRDQRFEDAHKWMRAFKERFGEDFYVEIQTHNETESPGLNQALLSLAKSYDVKAVVTGDCHYADPADRAIEEAFLIIGTNPKKIDSPDMSYASKLDLLDRFDYLYPDRQMRFRDIDVYLEEAAKRHEFLVKRGLDRPDLFENTLEIANKINEYSYNTNSYTLPAPEDKDVSAIFDKICDLGMKKRGLHNKPEYVARLEEEKAVIREKDIEVYFVILADALKFCRDNGIAYGAGRGSGAGSLVNYAMEITDVDPIEHKLLFWRFLDPERADMPDIDVDIQDSRRGEVKRYLERRYGKDKVASVTTYGTYKGKSAIKAACKALGVDYKTSDWVAKQLTDYVDDDAAEKNMREYLTLPALEDFRNENPDVYRIANAITGRLSSYGMHAGGVVITDSPLTEWTGIESRKVEGEDFRQSVIAIDKDQAEELGLVKYDFLGLKTLSVVADSVEFIRQNHGKLIDFKKIKETDPRIFEMISEGRTLGVFQATAEASTEVIKKMGIDNFNDLVASNALVRPGAWKAFGQEYIARKKGLKRVSYPTTESKDFLEETYGFYLYQEQTMQICTEVAGMTKAEANKIRKLTAKKKSKTELAPYKEKFMRGALKNVSQRVAEKLWADIELTAEYSFNKCLAEDTMVEAMWIEDGKEVSMSVEVSEVYDLVKNTQVWVKGPEFINGEKIGDDTWHEVVDVHDNGVQPVWRLYIDENQYIDSTAMHKHRLAKRWKETMWIHQNDVIWTDEGKKTISYRRFQGIAQTYDLELASEPHAFYANGILTHNSHAVAYSKLSYVTAWLKTYYPAEFMTALLKNEDPAKKDNKLSDYLAECGRMNIQVNRPNVNKSDVEYSTKDGQIYMGLSNIKGIGKKSAEKIIAARPFASYADLTEKAAEKGSGITKTHLDAMNAVGVAEFPDNPSDDKLVKENFYKYLGIPSLDQGFLTEEMQKRVQKCEDFDSEGVTLMHCIVKEITVKGWVRISVIDSSGGTSFFADQDHNLIKGHQYIMLVAKNSLIDAMDMSEYRSDHPLMKYVRGEMTEGNWVVGAKVRTTRTQKKLGTLVFTHRDKLQSCLIFESVLPNARMYCKRGQRVRLAINTTKKDNTLYLEGAAPYEDE